MKINITHPEGKETKRNLDLVDAPNSFGVALEIFDDNSRLFNGSETPLKLSIKDYQLL
jgi:hypothetical protein